MAPSSEFDPARTPNSTAQRFQKLKESYDTQKVTGGEKVEIETEDLPAYVKFGHSALWIVGVEDLTDSEKEGLNPATDTFIIDPSDLNNSLQTGLKALRPEESVVLGRGSNNLAPRFKPFDNGVSRKHVRITRSNDGKVITVKDLHSTNGTFVGQPRNEDHITTYTPEAESIAIESKEVLTAATHTASSLASEKYPGATNQDRYVAKPEFGTYAVFDGVGGHSGGEKAAAIAASVFNGKTSLRPYERYPSFELAEQELRFPLEFADKSINAETDGAGTTATLARLTNIDNTNYISIANVGDSRAYLLSANGELKTLTTDHSRTRRTKGALEAKLQQERLAETDSLSILSPEDQQAYKERNVIAEALGGRNKPDIDFVHARIYEGDRVILTTDGIHDNLSTSQIRSVLTNSEVVDYAAALTAAAQKESRLDRTENFRAKKDDMTAVVINI